MKLVSVKSVFSLPTCLMVVLFLFLFVSFLFFVLFHTIEGNVGKHFEFGVLSTFSRYIPCSLSVQLSAQDGKQGQELQRV